MHKLFITLKDYFSTTLKAKTLFLYVLEKTEKWVMSF